MSSIWESSFLVVDVETTGSSPEKNRMTEIAMVLVKGGEIVSDYSSLVNPRQFIPPYIARMTGISNEMAFKAPESNLVMREAEKFIPTQGGVFVAHNVRFDWSFVQTTFMREGLHMPAISQLCTLKLARRLLPQYIKKNVGALAQYFGIPLLNRHRAYADAKATALVLIELLEIAESDHNISTIDELLRFQNQQSPNYKPMASSFKSLEEKIKNMPDRPGVYYYYDTPENVCYVGKAKNLKKRAKSYFTHGAISSKRIIEMISKAKDIQWIETPTELHALLFESKEIKRLKPFYNRLDKKYRKYPFIKITLNNDYPKIEMCHQVQNDSCEYYGPFRNVSLVNDVFKIIDSSFKLRKCDMPIIPSDEFKPCLLFQLDRCDAPCAGKISKEDYFEEILKVQKFMDGFSDGIIGELEDKMQMFAEQLEFEKAAELKNQITELKRVFASQIDAPNAINKNNVVILLPENEREKTVDAFLIRRGLFAGHITFGMKSDLKNVVSLIESIFYSNQMPLEISDEQKIDELRVVNSWLYKQREKGAFIYPEKISLALVENEIQNAISQLIWEPDIVEYETLT